MTRPQFTLNFTQDPKVAVDLSRTAPEVRAIGSGQHAVSLVLDTPHTVSVRDFGGRTLGFLNAEGVHLYAPVIRRINYAGMIPVTMLTTDVAPDRTSALLHMRRDRDELVFGKTFPEPPQDWYPGPEDFTYIDEFLVPAATGHQPPPPQPEPIRYQQQPQNPSANRRFAAVSAYESGRKQGPVMWLLWFFTGWVGGHRYYLGDTKYAVGMTVLSFFGGLVIHNRMREKNIAHWLNVAHAYETPIAPLPEGTRGYPG